MTYPQWWERLVAAIIDGVILAIVAYIIQSILLSFAGFDLTMWRILGLISVIISVAIVVTYKVLFEAGTWQATPGKMVFGLKVVTDSSGRASQKEALMRTWPWWLGLLNIIGALLVTNLIGLLIALAIIAIFFTFFMAPVGRCIHDQTANMHVTKAGKGMVGGA